MMPGHAVERWRCVRRWLWLALPVVGVLAAWSGCDGGAAPAPQWNVLLITLDTTRADHVGAYGYAHGATPTIETAMARRRMNQLETAVNAAMFTACCDSARPIE